MVFFLDPDSELKAGREAGCLYNFRLRQLVNVKTHKEAPILRVPSRDPFRVRIWDKPHVIFI